MNNIQLDQIDKTFDRFTALPIVVSGVGRALYGIVELASGVVSGIFNGVGQLITSSAREDLYPEVVKEHKRYTKEFDAACLHMFFGSANIVKGIAEAIPGVNFLACWYNEEAKPIYRDSWTTFASDDKPLAQPQKAHTTNPPAEISKTFNTATALTPSAPTPGE